MNRLTKLSIAVTAALSVLAGCGGVPEKIRTKQDEIKSSAQRSALGVSQTGVPVDSQTVGSAQAADAYAEKARNRPTARKASRAWVGARTVDVQGDEVLPAIFSEQFKLSFDDAAQRGRVSLGVVAERLSRLTRVPVRVKSDVYASNAGGAVSSGGAATPVSGNASSARLLATGAVMPTPLPQGMPMGLQMAGGVELAHEKPAFQEPVTDVSSIEMAWEGTLSGFLDHLTARLNLSWSYRDGVVVIERYQTESFELAAFNGTQNATMSLSGGNSGSAGGQSGAAGNSSANMDLSESSKVEVLNGLKGSIDAMVRGSGGSVVLNESTARFFVTAPRDVMSRVRELVRTEDAVLQRQAQIQIDIYSVITNDADERGVDWTAVYTKLAQTVGGTITSPATLTGSTAGSAGLSILSSDDPQHDITRRWGGTAVLMQMLNEIGESAQHKPVSLIALNRQWARKTSLKTDGYVSETTPSTSSSAGSGAPGLKTSSVVTGDKYLVQPAILDSGNIMLKFGVSLTELVGMFDVSAGSGSSLQKVQTPVTSGTDDQGTVRLRPGDAMILTGLSRRLSTNDRRTLTEDAPMFLGGSRKAVVKREEFMIVVRAFQI